MFARDFERNGKQGVNLSVRLQPGARKVGVLEILDGQLKWGVRSAPVEGKANEELIRSMAKHLGLPKKSVELIQGARSRSKVLWISGVSAAEVEVLLRLK